MKKYWLAFVTLIGLMLFPQLANADSADFTVATVQNEYQDTNKTSYYSLKMAPQTSTTLALQVYNTGKQSDIYDVNVNTGITNSNGALDYTQVASTKNLSVPKELQFNKIATLVQKTITVDAGQMGTINVSIALPDMSFSGKILGGITVTRHVRETEKKTTGLTSRFAYAVPIVIRQSDDTVTPKLNADKLALQTDAKTNVNELVASIQNITPTIINGVTIKSELINAKGKVVFTKTDKNHAIAPQSNFTYHTSLNNQNFTTGAYIYRLKISDNDHHSWKWDSTVNITQKKAKAIAKVANKNTIHKPINWIVVALGIMAVIIVVLISVLWYILAR